MSVHKVTVRYN